MWLAMMGTSIFAYFKPYLFSITFVVFQLQNVSALETESMWYVEWRDVEASNLSWGTFLHWFLLSIRV